MQSDEIVDCFGLFCPLPIIETAKKIKELKSGQILEIIATDACIKSDICSWCKATGNEYLGLEEEEGAYRVFVKKGA